MSRWGDYLSTDVYIFKNGNNQEEKLEDGIINITRFDLNNRIISGTFEGEKRIKRVDWI